MKLNLSRRINLLPFPRKKHVFGKVAELAPEATIPISFFSQNFLSIFKFQLPQKLYHNFSPKYLFLERRCTYLFPSETDRVESAGLRIVNLIKFQIKVATLCSQ